MTPWEIASGRSVNVARLTEGGTKLSSNGETRARTKIFRKCVAVLRQLLHRVGASTAVAFFDMKTDYIHRSD